MKTLDLPGTPLSTPRSVVLFTDQTIKEVKNLGWLIRHASEVRHITLTNRHDGAKCGCVLTADLADGCQYITTFNSLGICREWVKRPCLRHAIHADYVTTLSSTNP